ERIPTLKGFKEKMKEAEGKWPEFGLAVRDLNDKMKGMPFRPLLAKRFTPSEPKSFSPDVQDFIQKKLLSALDGDERGILRATEGGRPPYPRPVREFPPNHHLPPPPAKPPPAPPPLWDRYRMRPTTGIEPMPFKKFNPLMGPP